MNILIQKAKVIDPKGKHHNKIRDILITDGKIVKIRWRIDGHLPHDTEHSYKKVLRCVKKGEYELTPKASQNSNQT